MPNSLVVNSNVLYAAGKRQRQIVSARVSEVDTNGFLDLKDIALQPSESMTLQNISNCSAFHLFCDNRVNVEGNLVGSNNLSSFLNTNIVSIHTGLENVTITNNSATKVTTIKVVRLGSTLPDGPISEVQLFFAPFAEITAIGSAVTTLANVVVQDSVLTYLVNDQVSAPAPDLEAFRICDSDGTPNSTGSFLMYLNTTATSANTSGTLFLYLRETD